MDAAAFPLLAGLIGISFAARLVAGWFRATPNYFPDEYLYAELARSLVESGRPSVRGIDIGFPSLLQPVLTAPTWLASDVIVSYPADPGPRRARDVAGRRPRLRARTEARPGSTRSRLPPPPSRWPFPDLLFASWVMAEPFAYPLFAAVVLAGTAALSEPSRRRGLVFVVLVALAAFARAQFAILPLCFVASVFLVGLRERRLRSVLREQALPLGVFAGVGLAVALVGVGRVLGLYRSALDGRADPVELIERIGVNALVLAYASGWILVPGALLALALVLGRPRSRAELAFGALFLTTAVALLLEASLAGAVESAQERYVFYVLPLVAVAFCVYAVAGLAGPDASRSRHLAVDRSPLRRCRLAGLTAADGKSQSPFLLAAFRFEEALGSPGTGSLALAAAAALLGIGAILLSTRPALATPIVVGVALAASAAASVGAVAFDNRNSASIRAAFLPAERSWIDRAGFEDVTLVRGADGVRTEALEQLFWNRSVDRVVLLPGAEEVDHFQSSALSLGSEGSLRAEGRPLTGPVLVDGYGGTIVLADAQRVASSQSYTLWRPNGASPPRALPRRPLQRRVAGRDRPHVPLAGSTRRDDRAPRELDPDRSCRRGGDGHPLPGAGEAPPRREARPRAARDSRVRRVLAGPLAHHVRLEHPGVRRHPSRQRTGERAPTRLHVVLGRIAARAARLARANRMSVQTLERPADQAPRPVVDAPPGRARSRRWPLALVALFCVATLYHWLQSRGHVTPAVFTDELMFSELARSLAEGNGLTVRGRDFPFPAVVPVLFQAPAWLLGGASAYALAKTLNAVLMCLAVFPAWGLARLVLRPGHAFCVAVATVAGGAMLYHSYLTSEAVAYPIYLLAVAVCVRALAEPSRRWDIAAVLVLVLAVLTRAQFAALPVAFLVAVLLVGRPLRRHAVALVALGALAVGAAVQGVSGLGFYAGAGQLDYSVVETLRWAGWTAGLLPFTAGLLVVPGALMGLGYAMTKARSRAERAFGVMALLLLVAGPLQAGLIASGEADRPLERYVFYAVPLLFVSFFLYVERGAPRRMLYAGVALALGGLALALPLASLAVDPFSFDSTTLSSVADLGRRLTLGDAVALFGTGGLVAALLVAALPLRRVAVPVAALSIVLAFAIGDRRILGRPPHDAPSTGCGAGAARLARSARTSRC